MKKKSNHPKCIINNCNNRATRWDGGLRGYVVDSRTKEMKPGYVVWLCDKHDPNHKYFDLPDTLSGAILDLVFLREELQKQFTHLFKIAQELRKIKRERK